MFCPYPSQNLVKAQYQQEATVLMVYRAIRAAFEVRGQRTKLMSIYFTSFHFRLAGIKKLTLISKCEDLRKYDDRECTI